MNFGVFLADYSRQCRRTDGKQGICRIAKECYKMNRIVQQQREDDYDFLKKNKCGNPDEDDEFKVCCETDELLKGNQCFNDRDELGECVHFTDCDELINIQNLQRANIKKITKRQRSFWTRSKCFPNGKSGKVSEKSFDFKVRKLKNIIL